MLFGYQRAREVTKERVAVAGSFPVSCAACQLLILPVYLTTFGKHSLNQRTGFLKEGQDLQ